MMCSTANTLTSLHDIKITRMLRGKETKDCDRFLLRQRRRGELQRMDAGEKRRGVNC